MEKSIDKFCKDCNKKLGAKSFYAIRCKTCSGIKRRIDITGQKFGRLTAIRFDRVIGEDSYWLFRCACGTEKSSKTYPIRKGLVVSCGCYKQEKSSKHNLSRSRFYCLWMGMWQRCNYVRHIFYRHYGGRGIKNLWKSFEEFRDDMYESYLKHVQEFGERQTTIERIDVDGHYCKENCRWTTYIEQGNNKRNNVLITFKNITKTISEWAKVTGFSKQVIRYRLAKGLSPEQALTEKPTLGKNKFYRTT